MSKEITFEELQDSIILWAEERDLLEQDPKMQLLKTTEELGELVAAVLKGRHYEEVDAIGDVLVTLIIYCEMCGLCPVRCLLRAYNEIADREGEVKDGVFVKAE